jgi:MFS family permease
VCIALFLLVMAALMIPCGKLTDRWGRKRCFTIGLVVYGSAPTGGIDCESTARRRPLRVTAMVPPIGIISEPLTASATPALRKATDR